MRQLSHAAAAQDGPRHSRSSDLLQCASKARIKPRTIEFAYFSLGAGYVSAWCSSQGCREKKQPSGGKLGVDMTLQLVDLLEGDLWVVVNGYQDARDPFRDLQAFTSEEYARIEAVSPISGLRSHL